MTPSPAQRVVLPGTYKPTSASKVFTETPIINFLFSAFRLYRARNFFRRLTFFSAPFLRSISSWSALEFLSSLSLLFRAAHWIFVIFQVVPHISISSRTKQTARGATGGKVHRKEMGTRAARLAREKLREERIEKRERQLH